MNVSALEIKCLNEKNAFLNGYKWDENGFCIDVLDNDPEKAMLQVNITFPPDVLSVRVTNESQSWKIEEQIGEWKLHLKNNIVPIPCFLITTQSSYIDWYKTTETIDNIHRLDHLKHYFFFIDDILIEVIDDRNPVIIQEKIIYSEKD